jgi:LacI family transcriptional regulator
MKRLSKPETVTIREVAERSGVSVAAASYALNGTGRVSDETRRKVLQAAEDLGYAPSLAAQALKGAKGNLVGILTDGFAGPWYGELLEGLQPTLKDAGFAVLALTLERASFQLCRSIASAGLLRGLVALNASAVWQNELSPLIGTVPTTLFDPDAQDPRTTRFVLDNRGGIHALMTHLWGAGYRDYLWLDGAPDAWDARERHAAYEEFLDERSHDRSRRRRALGGFRADVAYEALKRELSAGSIPRAIVAANDESAIGALRAVRERGLSVPGDVAIAGFDGIDASAWTSPALTTLSYDRRALGRRMASAVLAAIAAPTPPAVVTVPLELVIRPSTSQGVLS